MGLARARDEPGGADAAKTAFLAAMSRELRTPLNAIIGFSDMIAQQAFGPIAEGRYVDYARNTGQAGEQMLDFIVDVLTIAQLQAGRDELELESVDLAEVAEAAMEEFRQSEEGEKREMTLAVSGTPPLRWAGRRGEIQK